MSKLIELKLRVNKKNGQINMSIPKKKLDFNLKHSLSKYKTAMIRFEGFNE